MASLHLYTMYDSPTDMPKDYRYAVRRFDVSPFGSIVPTKDVMRANNPDALRDVLRRKGLAPIVRAPDDDPAIMETWV